jgi:hypothetical protein
MESKVLEDVGISPADEPFVLGRAETGPATARKVRVRDRRTERIEFSDAGGMKVVHFRARLPQSESLEAANGPRLNLRFEGAASGGEVARKGDEFRLVGILRQFEGGLKGGVESITPWICGQGFEIKTLETR